MSTYLNQAVGTAKETIGNLTGNEGLKEAGRKQWAEAKGEQELQQQKAEREKNAPEAYRAVDAVKEMGGAAAEKLGAATGNKQMESDGRSARAQAAGEGSYHEKLAEQKSDAQ
ncbi:hypothetical protein GGI15_000045 [Coemansia interrupta]|uniref:CsbD-like domain-containing protein n=1 Tax=Coemansia interrupta TaxID=1126814 RepID=A0A9W8LMQ1_9FUNG|nr:hypothetical protein GGI15_000045 [Coemansia interrupta]